VNQPDFEVNATLRARKLTLLVAPEAQVEGQNARLERHEALVDDSLRDHRTYVDVSVEKKVTGRLLKEDDVLSARRRSE
jgi:hypothetical protein